MQESSDKKKYKSTLNLPQTDFPIRANQKLDDPLIIEKWEKTGLYRKTFDHNKGKKKFLLADGPPYANGPIHLGAAFNKILKDIVTKSRRMMGLHVPCVPGWDCHGLPIEIKVIQEQPGLDRLALKKACRAYAQKWISHQMLDFKRIGVLMDWDRPYKTMDFPYEASVMQSFGQLVEKGFIERKNRTVPWCASCQTVLATAEVEYAERKDPSIYVLFELNSVAKRSIAPTFADRPIFFVVWTTTPWTLPLNRAVLLNPTATYAIVTLDDERYGVVCVDLVDKLLQLAEKQREVVATFNAATVNFTDFKAKNPVLDNSWVSVIKDTSVLLSDGTACVHCAPGAGPEDYETGIKYNLEIFSPVGPDGVMTQSIKPKELIGKPVEQVQSWVLQKLVDTNLLFYKGSIKHSYPHCWRCRKGLIFRATKQWFCSLTHNQLKEKAIASVDHMTMVPEGSHNRLQATIGARYEWCLSRQRVWGTPIPAALCTQCDYAYCTIDFAQKASEMVAQSGIEAWETVDITKIMPQNFSCPECSNTNFVKEQDILDVWFDAGLSHTAVYKHNPEVAFPLDVYLEGKDQHRGYFQSALLTSMALHDEPCMNTIITHGFTVDAKGRKMSKSLGNGVSPQELIEKIGVDGLRLWAASIDISGEAIVSDVLLNNIAESYRKIRNTCRFLLSNIYDFSYEINKVSIENLLPIDQYGLYELYKVHIHIMHAYETYNFTAIFHALVDYCTTGLSAFYLDIVKDRLYVAQSDGYARRSAQTVCYLILDTLTRDMAPILSLLAEQIADHYQKNKAESIHLQSFNTEYLNTIPKHLFHTIGTKNNDQAIFFEQYEQLWVQLKKMRATILKAIEVLREKGLIKHSLEAKVIITFNQKDTFFVLFQQFVGRSTKLMEQFIAEFIIISQVQILFGQEKGDTTSEEEYIVSVAHADGIKCPRCWQWQVTNHRDGLCKRCIEIVE